MLRDGRDVSASYLKAGLYDSLEKAAFRWERSVKSAKGFGSKRPAKQFLEIRYENLVNNTKETLQEVCAFLNIDFQEQMLDQYQNTFSESDDTARYSHHQNIRNPINTDSIGKWKKSLSEAQQKRLEEQIGSLLKSLNYR